MSSPPHTTLRLLLLLLFLFAFYSFQHYHIIYSRMHVAKAKVKKCFIKDDTSSKEARKGISKKEEIVWHLKHWNSGISPYFLLKYKELSDHWIDAIDGVKWFLRDWQKKVRDKKFALKKEKKFNCLRKYLLYPAFILLSLAQHFKLQEKQKKNIKFLVEKKKS